MKPFALRLAPFALAVAACTAAPLAAHDFWIEPLAFEVDAGKPVAVGLRVGEHFAGDPVMPRPESIVAFFADDGADRHAVRTTTGLEPVGVVATRQAGMLAFGYESRPSAVTLGAETFEQYLREEGLEHVIAQRATDGKSRAPGRELFARSVKSLVWIDGEEPQPPALAPLGLPLELVPAIDPYTLKPGSSLDLQLLYDGRPAAGILVVAMAQSNPHRTQRARTDDAGRVTLALDHAGPWLIKAVHMAAAPAGSEADWMSWWTSLTFSIRGG